MCHALKLSWESCKVQHPVPCGTCLKVARSAGPEVSAAVGADGRAWLWGFGTNNQLGNGNDDSDKEVPSLLKGKALQGQRIVQVGHT